MRIQFSGGAGGDVTGSLHIVEAAGHRILLDCGMIQGTPEAELRNMEPFDFDPTAIDVLIVSHAHIDHIGRVPLLVKRGFRGRILTQKATADLMPIMLLDAAGIQESDAERANRKRGDSEAEVIALYTREDVKDVLPMIEPCPYNEVIRVADGVEMVLHDAGHILGAASVELRADGKTLVFSGDIGPKNTPILRDPAALKKADLVLLESTYGDRLHKDRNMTMSEFGEILHKAAADNAKVLIPAFAVGRSQELLYALAMHYDEWGVDRFKIFLDSPMAQKVVEVYEKNKDLFDEEAKKVWSQRPTPFSMPNLTLSETADESKAINNVEGAAIIIAGSGMANAGRILHHLKFHLGDPRTHVCIVGYQGYGTLGRRLVDKAEFVRIHGENIEVRAQVHTLGGLSAHADQKGLTEWYESFDPKPPVVLVHGEDKARDAFAAHLNSLFGADVELAQPHDVREVS